MLRDGLRPREQGLSNWKVTFTSTCYIRTVHLSLADSVTGYDISDLPDFLMKSEKSFIIVGGFIFGVFAAFIVMSRKNIGMAVGYFLYSKTSLGKLYFSRELRQAASKFENGHSVTEVISLSGINILPVPFSNDNYAYIIWRSGESTCVLVDPAHPPPVLEAMKLHGLQPSSVLVTHKHWDHASGSPKIRRLFSNVTVYGSARDNAVGLTQTLDIDSDIIIDANLHFRALFTPGHTVGHMAYVLITPNNEHCLFSGDTMFLGGVGMMFEGNPPMYVESLDKLAALPPDTLLFPGHEYGITNLSFVNTIDPQNETANAKLSWAVERRATRLPTSPSRMSEELQYNPFFRIRGRVDFWSAALSVNLPPDLSETESHSRIFLELRKRKDAFKAPKL